MFRAASGEIFDVLARQDSIVLEKASVDEAFLDITEAVENEYSSEGPDLLIAKVNPVNLCNLLF